MHDARASCSLFILVLLGYRRQQGVVSGEVLINTDLYFMTNKMEVTTERLPEMDKISSI